MKQPDEIRDYVRERYGSLAEETPGSATTSGCCEKPMDCCGKPDSYSAQLGYSAAELAAVPAGADLGLGCGNPLALASIRPGETVLDLGSGAGFDAFLAAHALAGTGRVIGVDMTPAMIVKARRNASRAGHGNVEFRLGEIEALPVADASVDLIISNCVINLSPEKSRVFAEAFRVLKPGGRLAIADVIATQPLPADLREQLPAIGACLGGAITQDEMGHLLATAGFTGVQVVRREESRRLIATWGDNPALADHLVSAMISARKPTVS